MYAIYYNKDITFTAARGLTYKTAPLAIVSNPGDAVEQFAKDHHIPLSELCAFTVDDVESEHLLDIIFIAEGISARNATDEQFYQWADEAAAFEVSEEPWNLQSRLNFCKFLYGIDLNNTGTTPEEIANIDDAPVLDAVRDFCKNAKNYSSDRESIWEFVPEHVLAMLQVPGYPNIVPHRAWVVKQGVHVWKMYMVHENSSDTYAYEEVR